MEPRTTQAAAAAASRIGRAPAGVLLSVGLGVLAAAAPLAAQDVDPADSVEARSFAIPDTRVARALVASARGHIDARRWPEAIAELQELIREHRGEVLGAESESGTGEPSQQPLHAGAAETARRLLLELPAPARELYAERYGRDARQALDAARAVGDRRALVEVARRWPLTDAALDAWWTIGDLELELADAGSARAAWRRASELSAVLGVELTDGARARLDYQPSPTTSVSARGDVISAEAADAGARPSLPGPDCDSWSRRLDDQPGTDEPAKQTPFGSIPGEYYNLYPFLAGDTLLVSTSMQLIAYDAWSGAERWRSPEAPGWDLVDKRQVDAQNDHHLSRTSFFGAVEYESALIAPAASGGIAVCALQIPVTQLGNTQYQSIPITRVIPDRRLFAFDLETGRPLWNHMPPPLWDGESGSFSQRMRVAAPPVIVGSRILVPTYRMQGRINYHLACYDLFTGSLLWSTALISGQLPLNMFGRHQKEFAAAPVHVEGDRVIALTQLGAVASVDLYSGDILWETLYEQIPLPATVHWAAPRRVISWTNAAPLVADGVVVATPLDSRELIGLDLQSGAMLWSLPKRRISELRDTGEKLTLIGAGDDTVWLAGSRVIACRAPHGLDAFPGPIECTRGERLFEDRENYFPHPAMTEREIVVPTDRERIVLDRENVRFQERHASGEWGSSGYAGNLLLRDGALFSLNSRFVTACLDWRILEHRRLRALEDDPGDATKALAYAELLERRGLGELDRGSLSTTLGLLARARETLEPLLETAPPGPAGELRASLHRVLRGEARALELQANSPAAIERLTRARDLAPDEESLRDTLVSLAELHRRNGDRDSWFDALQALDERCGELSLVPRAGETPVEVGLWVRAERARAYADLNQPQAELEELHAVLARWGDVALPAAAGAPAGPAITAGERIAAIIEEQGREIYEPFEKRARRMLEAATADDDLQALERLAELYPHSAAAAAASDARLEAALGRGDVGTAVRIVQAAIPDNFSIARSSEREARLLAELSTALAGIGNAELADALRGRLAERHPDLAVDVDGTRRTLRELAAAHPGPEADTPPPEAGSFDDSALVKQVLPGDFVRLGHLPSAGAAPQRPVQILARVGTKPHAVVAFGGDAPGTTLWVHELDREGLLGGPRSPCHLTPQRIVVAGRSAVLGLDATDGSEAWSWRAADEVVTSIVGSDGVVLVTAESDAGSTLTALDAQAGIPLWRRRPDAALWETPVAGSGRVVLLPGGSGAPGRGTAARAGIGEVLDLFTGSVELSLEVGAAVGQRDAEGAWIEGETLILPRFPTSHGGRDSIVAFDLANGHSPWRIERDPDRELDSIVRLGSEAYLILAPGNQPGLIRYLDTKLGGVRPIQGVSLAPSDIPIGIQRYSVAELDGPYVFLRSEDRARRETLLRAIHLPFGERWTYRLAVDPDEIGDHPMPRPAMSRTTVAFAYTEPPRARGAAPATSLLFVNRNNGTPQDARLLDAALGKADDIELATFGSGLAILGRDRLVYMAP